MADPQFIASIYALISAFLFALTNHLQSIGLRGSDARTGAIIGIATATLAYWLCAPWFLFSWYWLTWGAVCFAVVGIFRPSLSSWLALSSIQQMGPTLTSALTASAPIFGAFFAILILGERLTLPIALGTLLVVFGVVVSAWRRQGIRRDWPLWALVLPLGAAFIRAAGHAGTKLGLVEVASPAFAVLVSNTVSFILAGGAYAAQGHRIVGGLASNLWFVAGGLAAGLSLHFLNSALAIGTLVSVVPIVSASPVFTMLLGLFVFRSESVNWRTVMTIALVVPGVVLVVLR